MAIEKAPHGKPCNGCGKCCAEELCPIAVQLFGTSSNEKKGPCPALTSDGDRFACGVILQPAMFDPIRAHRYGEPALSKAAAQLLGAGLGCDAREGNEPTDLLFLIRLSLAPTPADIVAALMWDFELWVD